VSIFNFGMELLLSIDFIIASWAVRNLLPRVEAALTTSITVTVMAFRIRGVAFVGR